MKKLISILISILIVVSVGLGTWTIYKKSQDRVQNSKITFDNGMSVNEPILLEGMKPVTFEEEKEKAILLNEEQKKEGVWYDYVAQKGTTENGGTSKWANAMTLDGSLWVWIPRYAYKIQWDEKSSAGEIDIMFLVGTTNYNKDGIDVTTLGYKVHPAFTNGENNHYSNGEWDAEIPGIWISKFEAGYAGQKNTASEEIDVVPTDLKYLRSGQNVLGEIKSESTYMTYPVFVGKTYSYNNIEIGEMYDLSQRLTQKGNPYGFNELADSHLLKNSEWGAVTYLAHSKYGRNGSKISINNIDVSEAVFAAETVTGYTGNTVNASPNPVDEITETLKDSYNNKSYAWYTEQGGLGSTTGNLFGIYDMNGASSEYTAAYIENINKELGNLYAKSIMENPTSTKYYTVYQSSENEQQKTSYEINKNIYGDAIAETSLKGNGYHSWFGETSIYPKESAGFFLRSGEYNRVGYSGIFDFMNHSGHASKSYSFRCALIGK